MTWATTTVTPTGGDATRVWRDPAVTSGPLLVYCHGVGGSETEFGIADYAAFRTWLDTRGWTAVEANAGGPGWGNDTQRACYRAAVEHVQTLQTVTDIVVFGRSMGGIIGTWLHLHDPVIAPLSRGLIACASVQDIGWAYDNGFGGSLRAAHGTGSRSTTLDATIGRDPIRMPATDYAGTSVLWQYGTADTVVDPLANVIAQRDRVAPGLTLSVTDEEVGGDHYTVRTRTSAYTSFLNTLFPPPVVEDGVYRRSRIGGRFVVGDDGLLYPLTEAV